MTVKSTARYYEVEGGINVEKEGDGDDSTATTIMFDDWV